MTIDAKALEMIDNGMVLGLGSGRAATAFIHALGQRVQQGLRVRGVPTSENTAQLARQLNIPLVTLDDVKEIDLAVDGADEVDPHLNLIKGLGGALVREKLVAVSARKFVVLVGSEKIVSYLGQHGVLPVEVIPFGLAVCCRRLEELGLPPRLRMVNNQPFVSDNYNYVLDCQVDRIDDPARLNDAICAIPGVVDTGLFVDISDVVLIQQGSAVEARESTRKK